MRRSPGATALWIRLAKCSGLVLREVRSFQQKSALTLPQFDVMAQLLRHPQGMTTGGLSKALLVTAGNVTGITARLKSRGLISVRALPGDRRVKVHRLTASGRRLAAAQVKRHEKFLDEVFAGLSGKDKAALQRPLDRLRSVLEGRRASS